eukprot:591527-Pleurochrysis_carterae.AAC.2
MLLLLLTQRLQARRERRGLVLKRAVEQQQLWPLERARHALVCQPLPADEAVDVAAVGARAARQRLDFQDGVDRAAALRPQPVGRALCKRLERLLPRKHRRPRAREAARHRLAQLHRAPRAQLRQRQLVRHARRQRRLAAAARAALDTAAAAAHAAAHAAAAPTAAAVVAVAIGGECVGVDGGQVNERKRGGAAQPPMSALAHRGRGGVAPLHALGDAGQRRAARGGAVRQQLVAVGEAQGVAVRLGAARNRQRRVERLGQRLRGTSSRTWHDSIGGGGRERVRKEETRMGGRRMCATKT